MFTFAFDGHSDEGGSKMKNLKGVISVSLLLLVIVITAPGLVTEAGAYERKSNNTKSVIVTVLPDRLSAGQPATFKISMSTHSVNLSQDMVAVSTLKDDKGNGYQPLSWNGSPPGGHHRSGVLEFPTIAKDSKKVVLIIKDISGVPERIFEWDMEQ